jgi:hypothetical protein
VCRALLNSQEEEQRKSGQQEDTVENGHSASGAQQTQLNFSTHYIRFVMQRYA